MDVRVGHKESWALKNWYFWTVMLEKTLENLLESKKIKLVSPKGNQSWIFIGRTDAEAEAPILWPPNTKSCLIRKDPDAGKDWRQEEKGTTEDEMVGCHHQLNGHEVEQGPGDGEGLGSLVCCSPWATKSQTQLSETEQQQFSTRKSLFESDIVLNSVAVRIQKCLCILNTTKCIFHTTHSNLKVSKHRSYTFIHFNQSDSTFLNFNNLTPHNPSLLSSYLLNFQDPAVIPISQSLHLVNWAHLLLNLWMLSWHQSFVYKLKLENTLPPIILQWMHTSLIYSKNSICPLNTCLQSTMLITFPSVGLTELSQNSFNDIILPLCDR